MSTLESAIVFSLVISLLTFMVTAPESVAMSAVDDRKIGSAVSYDASPEKLCTYLTGLSDNFRLIYGKAASLAS